MSLEIHSTDTELQSIIKGITKDKSVTLEEFRSIRNSSDAAIEGLSLGIPQLAASLSQLQSTADALSDSLQKLAIAIRAQKPDNATFDSIKGAVEHQLAYVVLSYTSSVERYSPPTSKFQRLGNANPQSAKANVANSGADSTPSTVSPPPLNQSPASASTPERKTVTLTAEQLERARKAFQEKDKDGNDVLSMEEFIHTLEQFLTPESIDEIKRTADVDQDGNISWDEFLQDYQKDL